MMPRVGVYLSKQSAGLLEAAAERPGATKSAVVEAALDRYFGSDDDTSDTARVMHHLAGLSRQIEDLDRNLIRAPEQHESAYLLPENSVEGGVVFGI
jgi:hypothetical protein